MPIIKDILKGTNDPNINPEKATVEEVWKVIEQDFADAAAALPKFEVYDGKPGYEKGRASKGAAQAYLGKSLLYQSKWSEAAKVFADLVNKPEIYGAYGLMPSFEDNFQPTTELNMESLFEVQFQGGVGNVWAGDDGGAETESNYFSTEFHPYNFANCYVSDECNKFFDDNMTGSDVRRVQTIAREGDTWDGVTVSVKNLFKLRSIREDIQAIGFKNNDTTGVRKNNTGDKIGDTQALQRANNWRVIRFSDVIMMYAEALNESGQTPAAYTEIAKVRARAGAAPLLSGDQATCRAAIKTERRLEFTFECLRWFDVMRWGEGATTFADRGYTDANNRYLPIPQSEKLLNPNLSENNFYYALHKRGSHWLPLFYCLIRESLLSLNLTYKIRVRVSID